MTEQREYQAQYGLTELVPDTDAPETQRDIDIVFVHGLGGDSLKSWVYPKMADPWINDPAFLGELYNTARIMTFGYNANVLENVTTNRVIDHANDLLEQLWALRCECKGRPLIFVAHSLGGLVVKRALILCQDDDRYLDIQEMTRSVIFMGTPHEGSDQATNVKVAQKIVSLFCAAQDKTAITRELEKYSETTIDINRSFMRNPSNDLSLLCFFETLPTRLPQGERMFNILVKEALAYGKQRQNRLSEEETRQRLLSLKTPTTKPTMGVTDPDTITVPREAGAKQTMRATDTLSAYDEVVRQRFLASLTGFTTLNFADDLVGPQPGTCRWIECHGVFQSDWLTASESRLLFITGAQGCGKTFLAKHIRSHLRREFAKPNFVLAFFCNNTKIHHNESPILQYFVKELVLLQPVFFHQVENRYRTLDLNDDSFSLGSLMEILQGILRIRQKNKIFLIIDGLDECDAAYVKRLLKYFHWMLTDDGPDNVRSANVARIAILCRPSPEIDPWVRSHLHINISSDDIEGDLAAFTETSLKDIGDERFHSIRLDALQALIQGLAGDSFLWADSIIKELDRLEDMSLSNIVDLCTKCPPDMAEYYKMALKELEMSNGGLFPVVLSIVLWGRRPLKTAELLAAAAIALDQDLSEFNLASRLKRRYYKIFRVYTDGEVDFVHHSLRELVTRTRDEKKGHSLMTSICLRYIIQTGEYYNCPVISEMKATDLAASHPFLKYARDTIFVHAQLAGDEIRNLVPLFRRFLCENRRYYHWWHIVGNIFNDQSPDPEPTPILQTMASHEMVNLLGLTDVLNPSLQGTLIGRMVYWWFWLKSAVMFQKTSDRLLLYESVLERDRDGSTLLHAAALGNCLDFAYFWRKYCAQVDLQDEQGRTALHYAAYLAHAKLVTLLLGWGADPIRQSNNGKTALQFAIHGGSEEILAILLARVPKEEPYEELSTDANESVQDCSTTRSVDGDHILSNSCRAQLDLALITAVKLQREWHVRLLLLYGVDPNLSAMAVGNVNEVYLLHDAIEMENDTIFSLLLDKCDLQAFGGSVEGNPLHCAVLQNRRDYVQRIIDQSRSNGLSTTYLDSRTKGQGCWPSISIAVSENNEDMLRLLLENGASPDTARNNGCTALYTAVSNNRLSHCQLLILHGCDVNLVNEYGMTALSRACLLPAETTDQVVATLLEAGADPTVQDGLGRPGPLHIAVEYGHTRVIKKLLACPIPPDIDACGEDFPTPLYQACRMGRLKCAVYLIKRGCNKARRFGRDSSSLLHAAAIGGNRTIIRYLLRSQLFNINEVGDEGLTPLALACREGKIHAATTLVQRGADPTARNPTHESESPSALFWCAASSSASCWPMAKLLLRNHKVRWHFSQEDLDSALRFSVSRGSEAMFKLLLSHNANMNSFKKDQQMNCLHIAARDDHVRIAKLLLLDARTNVLATDFMGQTALHTACNFNRVPIIIPLLLGVGKETPALPPLVAEQLLNARDVYNRRALDYRLLSHWGQPAKSVSSDNEAIFINRLRELLDPTTEYEYGDLKYTLMGKFLVFVGEDEYAIKSYQMLCQWVELKNEFHFDMGCTCDSCGPWSSISSTRMVCRTCVDIDLCESCYLLYQQGTCSETMCIGHEFLRVPTVPVDELRNNFPGPQDSEPSPYWSYARTPEMASIWMDELRAKFCTTTGQDDTPLRHVDYDSGNLPYLCEAKSIISPKMYSACLRFRLPARDNTENI
ncbi:peptidase C14 [Metarhizium brunneum]